MAALPSWHKSREVHSAALRQQYYRPSPLPTRSPPLKWRESWRGIVLGLVAVVILYTISLYESEDQMGAPIPAATGPGVSDFAAQRTALYDKLAADLETNGLKFLAGGDTTQNMKLSDIFTEEDGQVKPVLKALEVPVRANVLYIDPAVSQPIWEATNAVLSATFRSSGFWLQDPNMYHMSMYHASHDKDPIVATPEEVLVEERAVESVVNRTCPSTVELDRVVVTSTGVVMALWQLVDGGEPALLRDALKQVLPRSPRIQIYNRVILHTSLARILDYPILDETAVGEDGKAAATLTKIQQAVLQLNSQLVQTKCTIRELWYVEEHDLLALALKGRMTEYKLTFECPEQEA